MYFCGECREECEVEAEDDGFGPGEFWGAPYNHVKWVIKSSCCWGIVYTDEACTVEATYEEWSAEQEGE